MIEGLPDKLREIREQRNLSRRMVSEQIGVSQSILADYESGHRTPSLKVFMKLCGTYQCSPNILLGKDTQHLTIDTTNLTDRQINLLVTLISLIKEMEHE